MNLDGAKVRERLGERWAGEWREWRGGWRTKKGRTEEMERRARTLERPLVARTESRRAELRFVDRFESVCSRGVSIIPGHESESRRRCDTVVRVDRIVLGASDVHRAACRHSCWRGGGSRPAKSVIRTLSESTNSHGTPYTAHETRRCWDRTGTQEQLSEVY